MAIRSFIVVLCISIFYSCSEDTDVIVPRNLEEYRATFGDQDFGNVIACAATQNGNASLTNVFYYPEDGASDIRYYEAESIDDDSLDYTKYRRQNLDASNVFGGKLQRFLRNSSSENWAIVTYVVAGKLHISNPIRIKNNSKPTVYQDEVGITYPSTLTPRFTWEDNAVDDNDIYFQVISQNINNVDEFISGTYTNDNFFQYYDTSNVVLNITDGTPQDLEIDTEYNFTLMDVSDDNWVNLIIEDSFVPLSLQEYLDLNTVNTTEEITSFAGSANQNDELSYIYFDPPTNSRAFKYYETDSINVDETDFNNYRRKVLTDDAVFGAQLRRFSREEERESWYVITYEFDEVVYKSSPIRLRNATQPTVWETDITIEYPQTLEPRFTWDNFGTTNNDLFLHVLLGPNNTFISGVYTQQNTFQYYDTSDIVDTLNSDTPPDLSFDTQYICNVLGISNDNWVNLSIQRSFTAE